MNKILRKIIYSGLFLLLFLGIVACNSEVDSTTPGETKKEDKETEQTEKETNEASEYPTKEVTLIVPAAAGGTLDLAPRSLTQAFQEITGHPLVVENQPGGAMVTGAMKMVNAEPDGYTLAMLPSGLLSLRPALQPVEFTFPDDFTAIKGVGDFQIVYATHKDAPYDSMAEMVEYYRENGGEPRFGSSGVNTYGHILAAMVSKDTDMKIRHLPFDGNAGAVTAVLGGNAEVAVVNLSNVEAQLETGDLKILGVPSTERYSNYDQASTLIEQGIEVVGGATFSLYGPAGMSEELQQQLNEVFTKAMESDQFKEFVTNTNLLVTNENPEEVIQAIIDDYENIENIKADLE